MARTVNWIAGGTALGAAAAVAAGVYLFGKFPAGKSADHLLSLRCEFAYQLPVQVNIWPGRGIVAFDGGPILKIDQLHAGADGDIAIHASSDAYELFGTVSSTASIRFRSIPGNYDEIVCPIVTATLPTTKR